MKRNAVVLVSPVLSLDVAGSTRGDDGKPNAPGQRPVQLPGNGPSAERYLKCYKVWQRE
jgi:hypothetical protein